MASRSLTDWNDLHVSAGLDAVKTQLCVVADKQSANDESPTPSEERLPENPLYDYDGRYNREVLLENFWFLWGTDTCWDNLNRLQIRLSHLRHGVGKDKYNYWNDSDCRKTVKAIAYEPGKDLGEDQVNLFEGFAVEPNERGQEGCKLILQHLFYMCRNREDEFNFLLNWIAYPLQNPGAKMATSIVMFGAEGTGKSIIWEEVVKPIYGKHGATIGQAQLESQFTGWKSAKSFVVAEEVVSRQERNHHKGMLKQLVTGKTFRINEKNLPEHEESNHMNLVFNSNSTVPQELDDGDRRYLVLYGDQVEGKPYFDALVNEIENEGIACFMHFMLSLDLHDFDAHTKPPLNVEKQGLIDASMPSPAYFHKLWKAGELDIPYLTATTSEIYKHFTRWCDKNGEFKRTQRFFSGELQRCMTPYRLNMRYPHVTSHPKTVRVFLTPDMAKLIGHPNFRESVENDCRKFSKFNEDDQL